MLRPRARSCRQEPAHPGNEFRGARGIGLGRGAADQVDQKAAPGQQEGGGLIILPRRRAREEGAGVLQRVGEILHRRQAHQARVSLDGVEAALHRSEQLVGRLPDAPALLQLHEGIAHLLGQWQAFDDVLAEQLPERGLVQRHDWSAVRARARSTSRSTSAGWNGFLR